MVRGATRYLPGERPPLYVTDADGTTWRVFDIVRHWHEPGDRPPVVTHCTRHDPPHPDATGREFVRADRFMRVATFVPHGKGTDERTLLAQLRGGYPVKDYMRAADRDALRLPTLGGPDAPRVTG